MLRWLGSSDPQPTEEEAVAARRMITEYVAIANETEAEWVAMTKKWEANDYKDFDPYYQNEMQARMRDVRWFHAVTTRLIVK